MATNLSGFFIREFGVSFKLLAGIAACAVGSTVSTEVTDGNAMYELVFRFGALGLCAYMVFQNYRNNRKSQEVNETQRLEMLQTIRQQHQEAKEQAEQHAKDIKESGNILTRLHTETLRVIRKCGGPGDTTVGELPTISGDGHGS